MVLAAQKLKQHQAENEPGCEIVLGRDSHPGSNKLRKLVLQGAELAHELKNIKARLENVNSLIVDEMAQHMESAGTAHVVAGTDKCTIRKKDKVGICDLPRLQDLLREGFEDLVNIRTSYSPTKALTNKALDGDSSEAIALRECLDVEEGKTSVSYKTI